MGADPQGERVRDADLLRALRIRLGVRPMQPLRSGTLR
jgi:hypothetical protein